MRRKHDFITGSIYHVYNRGVRKSKIYNSPSDYKRWEELVFWSSKHNYPYSLYLSQIMQYREKNHRIEAFNNRIETEYKYQTPLINILAYVEMPNHFHLVIEQNVDMGIMTYMKKLQTAYAMYLNLKYDFSGSAFEGIYKSVPVISDAQLIQLIKYVLRNPIEAGLVSPRGILTYQWSSIKNYLDKTNLRGISKDRLPEELFNSIKLVQFLQNSDQDFGQLGELAIDNI